MQWYYAENGESVGPVAEEDLASLASTGKITSETLIWREGMEDWVPYSSLQQNVVEEPVQVVEEPEPVVATSSVVSAVPAAGQDTSECVECGKSFPLSDMLTYENSTICATCKPIYFQRMQEGVVLPGNFEYAGFWIRFVAKFVDGLILAGINFVISAVFGALGVAAMSGSNATPGSIIAVQGIMALVQISVQLSFSVFFLGKFGATPGKMACKLKVIRSDGDKITYGRAFGRFFGEMLSGIMLNIGYLMAAFDDEKRALHDRICDTRVVKSE